MDKKCFESLILKIYQIMPYGLADQLILLVKIKFIECLRDLHNTKNNSYQRSGTGYHYPSCIKRRHHSKSQQVVIPISLCK